jgi:hypothetical protein
MCECTPHAKPLLSGKRREREEKLKKRSTTRGVKTPRTNSGGVAAGSGEREKQAKQRNNKRKHFSSLLRLLLV